MSKLVQNRYDKNWYDLYQFETCQDSKQKQTKYSKISANSTHLHPDDQKGKLCWV